MKNSIKKKVTTFLGIYCVLVLLFILPTLNTFAQPPVSPPSGAPTSPPTSPPASTAGQPCWDSACIPVDGGVIFLLIAGALLGIRMIFYFNKSSAGKNI